MSKKDGKDSFIGKYRKRKQSQVECFFTMRNIYEMEKEEEEKIFENCVEMMRKTLPRGANSFIKFFLSTHTFTSVFSSVSRRVREKKAKRAMKSEKKKSSLRGQLVSFREKGRKNGGDGRKISLWYSLNLF